MFYFQTCWNLLKHLVSARTFSEMLKAVAASWNPKHVATPQGLELRWAPLNSMESVTPGLQPGPCQTPKQNAIFRIRIQIRKDGPPNMHHVSICILYICHPHFSNMGLLHSRLQWLHVWVIELEEAWCSSVWKLHCQRLEGRPYTNYTYCTRWMWFCCVAVLGVADMKVEKSNQQFYWRNASQSSSSSGHSDRWSSYMETHATSQNVRSPVAPASESSDLDQTWSNIRMVTRCDKFSKSLTHWKWWKFQCATSGSGSQWSGPRCASMRYSWSIKITLVRSLILSADIYCDLYWFVTFCDQLMPTMLLQKVFV